MRLQQIVDTVRSKCDALRAAESVAEWRFTQGEVVGAHEPGYDDSSWDVVSAPATWAGAGGDAWLRKTFSFPERVEGIPTAGARVELPLIVPIHSVLYVNGVERVAEPSWLDTRAVPLAISESYTPGQAIQVTLHTFQGDGFGLFMPSPVEVSTIEEQVFRLGVLRNQIEFTHYLAYEQAKDPNWQRAWESAAAQLDLGALDSNRWDDWWVSAEAALGLLQPMAREAKTYTTHLVGHSHIDMNWLWTWEETVDVIQRDFAAVDSLMERYPAFHFSQSQASTYHVVRDRFPELFAQVQKRVKQGNWEVTAATWVEGDLNMAAGESLARHLLMTRPYIEGALGVRSRICWEPDTFGHAGTMPQLLNQAGLGFYYFCRAGQGEPLFWWEGIDGSRVLAFNDPLGYNGVVDPDAVTAPVVDLSKRYGVRRGLFLYGVGDHGGGATARDIERVLQLDKTPLLPRAEMSSLLDFYKKVQAESSQLPVIRGELNTTFEGCYTSHSDIKKLNRGCENNLLTAETLGTTAQTLADATYPTEQMAEDWRTLLFHQFHDIICGCSIGAVYKEAVEALEPVLERTRGVALSAVEQLSAEVDTGEGGERVVAWNPLAWERTDLVRVPLSRFGATPAALVDDRGLVLPVQVAGDELLFVAHNLPALGCRVYRPTDEPASSDLHAADDATLRNDLLEFHVHPESGAIDNLHDLENQRIVDTMSAWRGVERKQVAGMINRLQIHWERPHPMSAWNIGDIARVDSLLTGADVRVVERGPVRATVEVRRQMLNSSIMQRYCLYAGVRRVDIETELDWHERGGNDVDAPMLRAIFKPHLGACTATFEVPFAGLERNATGDEVPALRWADVSDGEYGLSLLNNAKYGHQAHSTTLGLTLVRSSYEPDNSPDQGLQSFAYALYPHIGNWRVAGSDRRAVEFNQPVVAVVTDGHTGHIQPGQPLLTCEPANVMVTAVKPADCGDGAIVLRLVEMQGTPAEVILKWGWNVARVEKVNPIEEHITDVPASADGCTLAMLHNEVVTLRLTLA